MKYQIADLINDIKEKLTPACSSRHEAEQQAIWMLEEITNKKETTLLIEKEITLSRDVENKLNEWIEQRVLDKKPLQYIFGYVPFLNLKINVEKPILIPRPETEEWVDWLIKKLKPLNMNEIRILDIGSGSGCISLALAKNLPNSFVIGVDINPNAIKLAQENQKLNNIINAKFIQSDFYNNLDSKYKFDIIVSNPPYICENEWKNLDETVKLWEDKAALVAKNDCIDSYRIIIGNAKLFLRQNEILQKNKINCLFLEIGQTQGEDVKSLFVINGFKNIEIYQDLEQKQRWVSAGF